MKALSVYLDSSDYSVLSNPKTQTPETKAVRARLQAWADAGEVEFWYSAAHITEMTPLEAPHTVHASARADLLVGLCSRNALVSFDRLLELELAALRDKNGPPSDVYSTSGDWFPDFSEAFEPISRGGREKALADAGERNGLNREQRRKLRRHGMRGGERQQQRLWGSLTPEAIIKEYPMRPEDAKVLRDYMAGKATTAQAHNAFLASLREPSWMMRWFAQHSEAMTPIIEWMRGPARKLRDNLAGTTVKLSALMQEIIERRKRLIELGVERSVIQAMPVPDVKRLESESVIAVARRLIREISPSDSVDRVVSEAAEVRPGPSLHRPRFPSLSSSEARFRRWIQPVNATRSLNISAGVWKPSVLRGLWFSCLAIALS